MAREHETERRQQPAETSEVAPPQETPADTTYTGHGQIPAVDTTSADASASASDRAFGAQDKGGPEIDATREAMGQHVVQGMRRANAEPGTGGANDINHGIHYWYNYQRHCERAGKPELWQDKYRSGHTQSSSFINPHEEGRWMDWELKKGHSASKAIKEWLAGATIAECLSAVVAIEIDTLRAAIGDKKFDQLFGSADPKEDKAIPVDQRMHVRAGTSGTPVENFMTATNIATRAWKKGGEFGKVPDAQLDKELVPGQWYYFYNHPKYLLKHPGGAWQGENAIYMGKNEAGERLWSGLGATATEDHMIDTMVSAYNADRTDYDERVLKEQGVLADDGTFSDPLYDPKAGKFPDKVTRQEILTARPYTLDGTQRKGGFMATAGKELDADMVQVMRDSE